MTTTAPPAVKKNGDDGPSSTATDLYAVVVLVYFLQGALALARLATNFYLKDDLGLSAAEVAALTGFFTAPWVVKPIYGFCSDTIPLFGYRRKSYLFLSGAVGCASFVVMFFTASSRAAFLATNVVASAAVAFADVVADSVVVERSRDDAMSARLQSASWAARHCGSIAASVLSGAAIRELGAKGSWLATAPLPLLVALAAFAIREDPIPPGQSAVKEAAMLAAKPSAATNGHAAAENGAENGELPSSSTKKPSLRDEAAQQLRTLWAALTSDAVLRPVIFIFLWQATPSCGSAFFYFSTAPPEAGGLGFSPDFIGKASALGNVAGIIGVTAYNTFYQNAPLSKVIAITSVLSAVLGCLPLVLVFHLNRDYLGIDDRFFSVGGDVIQSAFGEIGFIPLLVLAAKVCPPGVEGSLFAAIMSIFNLGGLVSQELGALMTSVFGVTKDNFDNLAILVFLCAASSLLPLLVIDWVRQAETTSPPDATTTKKLSAHTEYDGLSLDETGDADLAAASPSSSSSGTGVVRRRNHAAHSTEE